MISYSSFKKVLPRTEITSMEVFRAIEGNWIDNSSRAGFEYTLRCGIPGSSLFN